jgi:hypothetical protein
MIRRFSATTSSRTGAKLPRRNGLAGCGGSAGACPQLQAAGNNNAAPVWVLRCKKSRRVGCMIERMIVLLSLPELHHFDRLQLTNYNC